jgi:hypothetical protein
MGTRSSNNDSRVSYYKAEVDDELFDDACDLGQFFLNPTWFLYVKFSGFVRSFLRQHEDIKKVQANMEDSKRSSWISLQLPLYCVLLVGGWSAVFYKIYPLLRASRHIDDGHPNFGYAVFLACLASWKYASSVSPGEINSGNMQKFDNYPYDNLLYVEDSVCPTLHQRKLARSKYDRYTDKHVPRFDHFCGWLRQPIGEENYREFLVFVGIHAFMCAYGSILIGILVLRGGTYEGQGFVGLLWNDIFVTIILMFLASVCLPLLTFFGFHMYLISKGMTTNEHYKWKLVHSRHEAATASYWGRQHQQDTTITTIESSTANSDEETVVAAINNYHELTDPGPCPSNLYDRGILNNFLEVVHPRSLRQQDQSKHD